ncbi:MAG TPA: DUF1330 domain-containing protein [Vicinamibacterales bacterium]|nr:DUF1330 domain-containing protein [Vicinamibacterales bacterium]
MSVSRIITVVAVAIVAIVAVNVISILQQERAPRRAYLLVQADVTHQDRYAEYAKVAPDIVQKYGGRYLARGGRSVTLEGPPARGRVVVIEFPSVEAAERFYASPEYSQARKLREGAADVQFVIVEAL